MFAGLTPLHVGVLTHNAVQHELTLARPGTRSLALLQRRKGLADCVRTLLLMGASLDAKVNVVLLELQVGSCLVLVITHVFSSCFTQDRKSGRTVLHMAAEEANIELLHIFLDQSNYFSIINAKVSDALALLLI